jgi:hypothetical protein
VMSLRAIRKILLVGLVLAAMGGLRAEEITLKDGKKITGTVVGFENGMFRLETDFGFALIKRETVKSISFGPGDSKNPAAKAAGRAAVERSSAQTTPSASTSPAAVAVEPAPKPPPAPPVSRPLDEPLPTEIRERVEGNTYINETFQFSFYKPPGWKVHENAARETGRAIVALGPEDEHTVLFAERQVWSGAPNLKADATDANLRNTYRDYKLLSETSVEADGHPALRREFSGVLDGAEWRGISLRVAQGNTVFGLVGLTSAENLQFQQAVLNKIIVSFRFLPSGSAAQVAR